VAPEQNAIFLRISFGTRAPVFPYSMTVNASICKIFVIAPHALSDTRTRVATGKTMRMDRQRCPWVMKAALVMSAHVHKEVAEPVCVAEGDFTNERKPRAPGTSLHIKAAKPLARTALNVGAHS
jgi:hypothetical protein